MDISVLKLFVAVVRKGSFAAVARDRNIDPSSVSRAIATLETELGNRLLQRTTRKLSLTEAGITYFERIEPLVEEIQQASDALKDFSRRLEGTLRATASVAFGLTCIVPILPAFKARYPRLTIDLLLTDSVVDLVAERVDLAVRLGRLEDSSLIAQRLMPVEYRVCASADYLRRAREKVKEKAGEKAEIPQSPSELSQHDCLCFPLAGFRSRWIFRDKAGQISEVAVQGRMVISNAIALQQCASAGIGVARLPNRLVDADIAAGRLVNLFPTYAVTATDFNTAAWFVYPSRKYVPMKVKVFMDFLRQTNLTA
ncbi:MAG: LysR substrate-binding domain-containing protein [Phormidesmis sp.]